MKKEVLERAIELNNDLQKLEKLKDSLESFDGHLVYFGNYDCREFSIESTAIRKILKKHDQMIRQEIDEGIQGIYKEIEQL